MHFVLTLSGTLRTRPQADGPWTDAAGVLTAPDVPHAIDATGREVFLVFLDPESEVGSRLRSSFSGPVRLVSSQQRDQLLDAADPRALLGPAGAEWTARAAGLLGDASSVPRPPIHPAVRRLLRRLRDDASKGEPSETSLETLAELVGLSAGRLMHVFTTSVGIPLRPYLAWLKLQRAAGAIVTGAPLTRAALAAGFADAAHMSRTFRRMFGIAPSALMPGPRSPPGAEARRQHAGQEEQLDEAATDHAEDGLPADGQSLPGSVHVGRKHR